MNKKKLKKLALKGVCGGLLMSAPALGASQGSDAMANFVANSSGQAHTNYLAGGCKGGCGGGGVARNQSQSNASDSATAYEAMPQANMGWNSSGAYQYQGHSCSGTSYQPSYQSQGGYSTCSYQRSNQGYSSCSGSSYQPSSQGYGSCGGGSSYQPTYQSGHSCGGGGGCGGYSNRNQSNNASQTSYANANRVNDGVEVEYDNNQNAQPNSMPKKQGQMALNDSMPRTMNDAQTGLNRNMSNNPANMANPGAGNQWQNQRNPGQQQNMQNPQGQSWQQNRQDSSWGQGGQAQQSWQQHQPGQAGQAGQINTRIPGQLATGSMMQSNQKMSKADFEAYLQNNPSVKSEYDSLTPAGKTLALKLANQDCAHKNDCKGLGGCKGKTNSCAGQNSCKGTSETNFKDKSMAVKVAKMAEKRNSAVNSGTSR